jgi:hypothetical protein
MPAKVLRAPFQYAAKAGAFTADKVNTAVDMSIDSAKSGLDSVMEQCVPDPSSVLAETSPRAPRGACRQRQDSV